MNAFMQELAARFGTGEAQGERPDEGDGAQFPDGTRVVECTNWARQVKRELGARAEIRGFSFADNPDSEIARGCGGHDFALVDGRYIVDGWAVDVEQIASKVVFDLEDERDHAEIARLYGDRAKWEVLR